MSTPSLGTAYIDGYKLGKYQNKNFDFGTIGLPIAPRLRYRFKPAKESALFGDTPAVISGAGKVQLVASPPYTTLVSYQGYNNVIKLDVARSINFSIFGTLTNAITFTLSGFDYWGHKVTETVTLASGSTANSYTTKKTYSYINSIYTSAGSGSITVSILTGPAFGFPYFIPHQTFVLASINGAPDYMANITDNESGSYTLIAPHTALANPISEDKATIAVGDTNVPTATTGDPRGLYSPNPNIYTGTGSDWITLDFFVPGFDCQAGQDISPNSLPPSQSYAYGVTQYSTGWQ